MLTQLTGVSLAGASVQLSEKGKRLAEAMAEAQKAFLPATWELAKTLMYALALPFSLLYHDAELRKVKPKLDEYVRELEAREGRKIAAELEAEGYGNPHSQKFKQEYFKRLADAKSADDDYVALSRRADEHQSGAQGAAALFTTYMIAWQNHTGMGEVAFVAHCERIVKRLHVRLNFSMPDSFAPCGFAAVYKFMKNYGKAMGNEECRMRNEE